MKTRKRKNEQGNFPGVPPTGPMPKKTKAGDPVAPVAPGKTESGVDKICFAELPLADETLEPYTAEKVRALLIELDSLTLIEQTAASRSKEIELELEQYQEEAGSKGFRVDTLCFAAREMPGRKTLNKIKLVENGVDPKVIEASMSTGEPFMQRYFKNIDK